MSAGFFVKDAAGNLKVDGTKRLLRFLGTIVVGPGPASGTVVDDGFLTGTPFRFCSMHSNNGSSYWPGESLLAPSVTIVGNVLTYNLDASKPTVRIQYGVR